MNIPFDLKTVDLHTHSTASDGTLTPLELILRGAEIKLSCIAITDHNTVDGIEEAVAAGKRYDVEVIPGVEMTGVYRKRDIHILGYHIEYKNRTFQKKLELIRFAEVRQIVDMARSMGEDISMEKIVAYANTQFDECVKFAGEIINGLGIKIANHESNIKKYIELCKSEYLNTKALTVEECILSIKEAGGLPVLAHPAVYGLDNEELDCLVRSLVNFGLAGIEAIHPSASEEYLEFLKETAHKYNICITGGSDFHGENKENTDLGMLNVPYFIVEQLNGLLPQNS